MNLKHLWSKPALELANIITEQGYETRKVGGSVRDGIVNKPCADEDMCTTASPIEMLELANRLGLKTIPSLRDVEKNPDEWLKGGLKHGTVPFVYHDEVFEITTLRTDVETDGRHARVEFIRSFKEDAARRDFTINAMSVDTDGNLYDYFNGEQDLAMNKIRFVGDSAVRIREDYLRILRYFRFHARFSVASGNHEKETLASITTNATGLKQISGERIWQEMSKILIHPNASLEIPVMQDCGVLGMIGLEVKQKGVDLLRETCECNTSSPVALGLLLAQTNCSPQTLKEKWRFGNDEADLALYAWKNAGDKNQEFRFWLDQAVLPRAKPQNISLFLEAFGKQEWAKEIAENLPVFPIKGEDLLELGIKQGPEMGKMLQNLHKKWQLSDYKISKEEMLSEYQYQPLKF